MSVDELFRITDLFKLEFNFLPHGHKRCLEFHQFGELQHREQQEGEFLLKIAADVVKNTSHVVRGQTCEVFSSSSCHSREELLPSTIPVPA